MTKIEGFVESLQISLSGYHYFRDLYRFEALRSQDQEVQTGDLVM